MNSKVLLTAIGSDRPGLTQALADAVLGAGGNWLESHLSRLGGKYVGAVLVEIEAEKLSDLEQAVRDIDGLGVHLASTATAEEPEAEGEELVVELVGQDRPGIVREVTAVLTGLGANIEDFASGTENSSWSGERLFRATARVKAPAGLSADAVRDALEAISGDIMIDFSFS